MKDVNAAHAAANAARSARIRAPGALVGLAGEAIYAAALQQRTGRRAVEADAPMCWKLWRLALDTVRARPDRFTHRLTFERLRLLTDAALDERGSVCAVHVYLEGRGTLVLSGDAVGPVFRGPISAAPLPDDGRAAA